MRTLTVIPVIHTPEEFGSLEQQIVSAHTQANDETLTCEFLTDIKSYWEEVQNRIMNAGYAKPSLATKLHIFIDGLPNVIPHTIVEQIIHELQEKKIPMYRIAIMLCERGAHIHGTEDTTALMNVYNYWKSVIEGHPTDRAKEAQMLEERDIAIARRINAIVPKNEHALLFIGRGHDVVSKIRAPRKKWIVISL